MNPDSAGHSRRRLSSDGIFYLVLTGIITAGFLIRINQLGRDDLWLDEAFTGFIALTREWIAYLRVDNTPPLYYLIQRGWCDLVFCSEFGLRLTSALAGTAFIALAGVFCRQLCGRKAALLIALVAALSPIHVYYSQEARVYSILLTVLLLFLYLQWRVIAGRAAMGGTVLLFITSAAALYLHYFSLVVVGTCLCVYAVEAASGARRVPPRYFLAVGASLAVFIPWLFFSIFSQQATSSELHWIADYFAGKSVWQLPVRSIVTFLAGPQFHYHEANLFMKRYAYADIPTAIKLFNAFLSFLFLTLYVLALARVKRLPAGLKTNFLEFSAFTFLPLFALIAASLLITPVYVVGRYDLIAYPAFLVLAACLARILLSGKPSVPGRLLRGGMALLFLLFIGAQAYKIAAYREAPPYRSMKGDVTALTEEIRDGDGLLVATPRAILVWYYLEEAGYNRRGDRCFGHGISFTCRLFPRRFERAPASQQRYFDLYRTEHPSFDLGYFLNDLPAGARVLLLLNHVDRWGNKIQLDPVGLQLVSKLREAGYYRKELYPGINLLVFDRETAPH
jgi:uncharacterized membrane protein